MSDIPARVAKLEESVGEIKSTLARMESKQDSFSTREDLGNFRADVHNLLRQQIMWSVGTVIATGGLAFAIARFFSS